MVTSNRWRSSLTLLLLASVVYAQSSRRLHITNACSKEPLWIAHEGRGPDHQNIRIAPGETYSFATPDGLSATRYWPKMGCDEEGNRCGLGDSGGPGQSCVKHAPNGAPDYSRCAPPIDTKFEATFGRSGFPCSSAGEAGCDFVDVSLVDGYTLPFRLETSGQCKTGKRVIDCSGLSFETCPADESLLDSFQSLRAVNPATGKVAGCYSPCSKLISNFWNNKPSGVKDDAEIVPYCCPTPPESPEACRAGPVARSAFVSTVHSDCPGVYAYAYDDQMGLMKCDSTTQYNMTFFCPSESQTQVHRITPQKQPEERYLASCHEMGCGHNFLTKKACQCHEGCVQDGNCCPDYQSTCTAQMLSPAQQALSSMHSALHEGAHWLGLESAAPAPSSQIGHCAVLGCSHHYDSKKPCQCDPRCVEHEDCCSDYQHECGLEGSQHDDLINVKAIEMKDGEISARSRGGDRSVTLLARLARLHPQDVLSSNIQSAGACLTAFVMMALLAMIVKRTRNFRYEELQPGRDSFLTSGQ